MIWILIALMACVVVLALIVPVLRGVAGPVSDGRGAFAGQLAELKRDHELGFIDEDAARQAELDIRRRISQAGAVPTDDAARSGPGVASKTLRHGLVAGAGGCAIVAVALYMALGSPYLVGMRPAPAPEMPEELREILAELDNLRAELANRPDNPQGWAVLGQAQIQLGRYGEAAIAFENAINWEPASAFLFASLGQARLFEAGGEMTPAAREAFARALDLDPGDVRARFFMAEAQYQAGDRERALDAWRAILTEAGPDAAYRSMVEDRLRAAEAEAGTAETPDR
ncbi:c-type cytochrome biogenesis protein CcmI [Maricaulis sp.]|uniref:c-type cytochrome biogenesis protein CcmI n=1 Tax=Maricaulis sp. TaxID=1486257 RepID=UPI002B268803|nr:c-type cytochrome biogenesis protein CcmI [Maricaulis sp.]